MFHRGYGVPDFPIGGHDDHGNITGFSQALQKIESRSVRKAHVEQHEIRFPAYQTFGGSGQGRSMNAVEARLGKATNDGLSEKRLVLDEDNRRARN